MPKIEILAPVGSEEMLRAAVFSGADAVYLGFSGFNARTGAGNFDADSLKEAVRFCHARGVKVHVALNTTVYGGELAALAGAVKAVAESGADAVICQDLAVAQLIGRIAPDLPRHGSTQMSVHTLQGALELKELGFTRVVLAREPARGRAHHKALRHRDGVLCPWRALHVCQRPVLYVGLPGRPQRQPGLLRRALPPAF